MDIFVIHYQSLAICKTAELEARVLDISVFMFAMHIHLGLCSLGASPAPTLGFLDGAGKDSWVL